LVTSIIRFTIFFNVKALINDGTFASANLAIWYLGEPGTYLLAACFPPLRLLMLKVFGGIRGVASDSSECRRTDEISLEWRARRDHFRLSDEDKMLGP
jgi:hypothetical protein